MARPNKKKNKPANKAGPIKSRARKSPKKRPRHRVMLVATKAATRSIMNPLVEAFMEYSHATPRSSILSNLTVPATYPANTTKQPDAVVFNPVNKPPPTTPIPGVIHTNQSEALSPLTGDSRVHNQQSNVENNETSAHIGSVLLYPDYNEGIKETINPMLLARKPAPNKLQSSSFSTPLRKPYGSTPYSTPQRSTYNSLNSLIRLRTPPAPPLPATPPPATPPPKPSRSPPSALLFLSNMIKASREALSPDTSTSSSSSSSDNVSSSSSSSSDDVSTVYKPPPAPPDNRAFPGYIFYGTHGIPKKDVVIRGKNI
jgi:hypothetical protein